MTNRSGECSWSASPSCSSSGNIEPLIERWPMKKWTLVLLLCAQVLGDAFQEGEILNVFLTRPGLACHVTLKPGRLLAAFPAENSGLAFWFGGRFEVDEVVPGEPQQVLIRGQAGPDFECEEAVLGSIRTVRRRKYDPDGAEKIRRLRRQAGLGVERFERQPGRLVIEREAFNGGRYRAEWTFPESVDVTLTARGFRLVDQTDFPVTVKLSVPFEAMQPMLVKSPGDLDARGQRSLAALRFLSRGGKLMAGSWRFLTYFGRDTLISLALLEPAVDEQFQQLAVESVLERVSPSGQVAHEEDIGDWAVARHLEEGGRGSAPLYDYKMVDDDFLLSAVMAQVLDDQQFEALRQGPQADKIEANFELVLDKAEAGLVEIVDPWVGDWRDSEQGLGRGRYPGNVNFCLVPAALRAINRWGSPAQAYRASQLLPQWVDRRAQFWVELSAQEAERRLKAAGKNHSVSEPISFLALSLDQHRQPVEVMNSDISFLLFFGQPSEGEMGKMLRLLERDFPVGLMTPIGPMTANPAYSRNPIHWKELGARAYHGEVVWSWQSALMMAGLIKQYPRYPTLQPRILKAIDRLVEGEQRAGLLATSELWAVSPEGEAVAYGAAGDQSESNAYQLWSTAYLGNLVRLRELQPDRVLQAK